MHGVVKEQERIKGRSGRELGSLHHLCKEALPPWQSAIHREAGVQRKMENRPSLEHLLTTVLRKCLLPFHVIVML